MDIFKETMKHFELDKQPKKEEAQPQEEDQFAGFGSYYSGGQRVVDLTSCDFEYEPTKFNHQDIERQQIYGDKAGNPNRM